MTQNPPSVREEIFKDNPISTLEPEALTDSIKALHKRHFKDSGSVTVNELLIGAQLARSEYISP